MRICLFSSTWVLNMSTHCFPHQSIEILNRTVRVIPLLWHSELSSGASCFHLWSRWWLTALQDLCGDWRTFQKNSHLCNSQPSGSLWELGQMKPLLNKWYMTAHLEFAKRHLKDPQAMIIKIYYCSWPECQMWCLEEFRHSSSPGQYCPYRLGDYGLHYGNQFQKNSNKKSQDCKH